MIIRTDKVRASQPGLACIVLLCDTMPCRVFSFFLYPDKVKIFYLFTNAIDNMHVGIEHLFTNVTSTSKMVSISFMFYIRMEIFIELLSKMIFSILGRN